MKKRNGFTLVELLAVIVVLAIIMILAIPSVLDTLEVARRKTFIEYIDKVVTSAQKAYVEDQAKGETARSCIIYDVVNDLGYASTGDFKGDVLIVKTDDGVKYYVTLYDEQFMVYGIDYGEGVSTDLLEDFTTEADEKLSKSFLASLGNCTSYSSRTDGSTNPVTVCAHNGITYEAAGSGDTYKGILYLDPTNLCNICNASNSVSSNGVKSGCMKFYIYNDNGTSYDAILDHNTTPLVKFTYKQIYSVEGSIWTAINGPDAALDQLKSDTANWTGIPTRSDSYYVNVTYNRYNIDYSGYRAKLISYEEVAAIAGLQSEPFTYPTWYLNFANKSQNIYWTSKGNNPYKWLYDHSNYCESTGCDFEDDVYYNMPSGGTSTVHGYWTATAEPYATTGAFAVDQYGSIETSGSTTSEYYYGIRPVITIPKSYIN